MVMWVLSEYLFLFIGKNGWLTGTIEYDAIPNFATIVFRYGWTLFSNFNDSESFLDMALWKPLH